jgi:type VI secretion system secreted protein VgrG
MSGPLENLLASAENRLMALTTPLEDETLLLHKVSAREEISELFEIRAEVFSPNPEIDFDQIVGQSVSIRVETPGGGGRFFNGMVSNFSQGDTVGTVTAYTLVISPWLWFLSQNQRCRIFPNRDTPEMTIKDILQSVLSKWEGFAFDLQFDLQAPVKYCVQYLESDFAFCSRIMEETGLGYYFTHEEESHTLVVFDQSSTPAECPTQQSVRYWPTQSGASEGLDTDIIKNFRVTQAFHASTFTTSDFNPSDPGSYNEPGAKLIATTSVTNGAGKKASGEAGASKDLFEVFHYPGRFELVSDGESLTKQMASIAEQYSRQIELESECAGFTAGHKFEMVDHPRSDYDGEYLLTKIEHTITQPIGIEAMDDPVHYSNKARCMALPSNQIPFIPKEKTPKPIITGVQVATVVSPDGKGLDIDEKGCILVKFPWDLEKNTTSCRMRVSQSQAGSRWGGISIPHVGQEVLVGFLGGDPDRPLVVGRVYNESNLPELGQENETRTTISNHGGALIEMEGGAVPDLE